MSPSWLRLYRPLSGVYMQLEIEWILELGLLDRFFVWTYFFAPMFVLVVGLR